MERLEKNLNGTNFSNGTELVDNENMANTRAKNLNGTNFSNEAELIENKNLTNTRDNNNCTIWSIPLGHHDDESSHQVSPQNHEDQAEIKIYKRRFWILGIFSCLVFTDFLVWGTFGPIMASAEKAYGWSDGFIASLNNWGCICSVLFMFPLSWFNNKYGVRKGVLLAAFLITSGAAARCVTTNDVAFTYLASYAAFMSGVASCSTQSLPAMISALWFPPKERTTATAISILVNQLAVAAIYLSPLIVGAPSEEVSIDDIKHDIRILMYIHFGFCAFVLLGVILYFPDKPPSAPSISSTKERTDYLKSIKILLRKSEFLIILGSLITLYDFPVIWFSVMNFSLQCIDIDQDQAMYIALSASLIAAVAALVAARLTDRLHGHMKKSILCLALVASAFFFWFLFITEKVILFSSNVQVYIAITGGIATSYSAVPIMFEFAVEMAYPCPEDVVGAIIIFFLDSVGVVFLALMMIPVECYRWISYVLAVGAFGMIFPLLTVKEERKRSDIDETPVVIKNGKV